MTYTEFKRTAVKDTNIQLLTQACTWFQTKPVESTKAIVFMLYHIQPTTDAHEIIIRLMLEHLEDTHQNRFYTRIHMREGVTVYVYDSIDMIKKHNEEFSRVQKYQKGRMVIVMAVTV